MTQKVQVFEGDGIEPIDWNLEDWVTLVIHHNDGQPKQEYMSVKVTQKSFDLLKGKYEYRVNVAKNATASEYKVNIEGVVIESGGVAMWGVWLLTLGDEENFPRISVDKMLQ